MRYKSPWGACFLLLLWCWNYQRGLDVVAFVAPGPFSPSPLRVPSAVVGISKKQPRRRRNEATLRASSENSLAKGSPPNGETVTKDNSQDMAAITSSSSSSSSSTQQEPLSSQSLNENNNFEESSMSPEIQESWLDYDAAYTILASAVIGVLSGFAVALFKLSIEALREMLYGSSLTEQFYWWLVPAAGGLGVSLVAATGPFSPGLRGTATEIDACSINTQTDMRLSQAGRFLRKPLAAIFTLGSGASLGPEGPSVEVGMTISRLCMPPSIPLVGQKGEAQDDLMAARIRRNRLLLSAGAAAGVSAGFDAPLSGVFFALEVVQQSLPALSIPPAVGSAKEADIQTTRGIVQEMQVQQDYFSSGSTSITAILLSSVLSALVAKVYLAESLVLSVPIYELKTPLVELPMYVLLGVVSGVVAGVFTALAQFFKAFFDGQAGPPDVQETMGSLPKWSKPIIGGLICGAIGAAFPQILFFGYETLNTLLAKKTLGTELVFALLAVKTLATAISAGSGLVGGTFAPSLFLGGMTGALFHNIVAGIFLVGGSSHASIAPFELADVQAYALVGAAGVLSALFRAPLTASLLLFELTRDYDVILPLMATAGVGSIVGDVVQRALEEKRRDQDSVSWGDLADKESQ